MAYTKAYHYSRWSSDQCGIMKKVFRLSLLARVLQSLKIIKVHFIHQF